MKMSIHKTNLRAKNQLEKFLFNKSILSFWQENKYFQDNNKCNVRSTGASGFAEFDTNEQRNGLEDDRCIV